MDVEMVTKMRRKLRDAKVEFRVEKNTLTKRALAEELRQGLVGLRLGGAQRGRGQTRGLGLLPRGFSGGVLVRRQFFRRSPARA